MPDARTDQELRVLRRHLQEIGQARRRQYAPMTTPGRMQPIRLALAHGLQRLAQWLAPLDLVPQATDVSVAARSPR
jgi:hypothetical protein